jgi:ATP-dependent Clp protease ATP-binding subunit ClpA
MFERYTEHARRVIFFGRYEASQFGSDVIEPEHLLLALYRDDASLMSRFVPGSQAEVRSQIERENPPRPKVSTNLDLPLSHAAKRVLMLGMEEAERMAHRHIGTEHLLLGLLREPSLASRILEGQGMRLEVVREQIARSGAAVEPRNLTPEEAATEREALHSLIAALPDDALLRTRQMVEEARVRIPPPSEVIAKDGHFSSSSLENGTMIFEMRRIHQGHRITLFEKLRVSDDGKTLHYSQELRGPKGEHNWSKDFDIT